ncbi:MAG: hypothetical protein ACYC4N_31095 [Pirellulaceae bacterium]
MNLIENYYTYDQAAYNRLFETQLEELLARITDPAHRAALESMRTFNWVGYISSAIRKDFKDQREALERTHDVVTKLLTGTLFRGFDETKSGPMPQRFRTAVTNAVKNLRSKEFNRRKYLPSVPITNEFQPGSVADDELVTRRTWRGEDREVVQHFRRLVKDRLGELALAVLDARLAGQETQSLVGAEELGRPDKNRLKKAVQQVKALAREYAMTTGDQGFLRDVDRAMGREQRTVDKRLLTTRQGRVGIEM